MFFGRLISDETFIKISEEDLEKLINKYQEEKNKSKGK